MRKLDLARWEKYFGLREDGLSVERSARGAKIDPKTAMRFEKGEPGSTGVEAAKQLGITHVAGIEVAPPLSAEAQWALDNFAYFRRRYFGRVSSPWQEMAAEKIVELLETDDREYAVINCPPGSGKSTLFTHDIPAWLIARDRSVRILFGHRVDKLARQYVGRLKKTMERPIPLEADSKERDRRIAFDAEATLEADYGAFKPEGRSDLWRYDALAVRQYGGSKPDDKEPTVSAFGADSGFLGGRYDFVIWDDLVDKRNLSGESLDNLIRDWVNEFETRIEPGGLMVLQGQRMAPNELYRFCLDLTDLDGRPKYHHIKFQAHAEDRCKGHHQPSAVAYPTGCLLDPYRLPWKFLSNIQASTPRVFDIQYQQNDGQAAAQVFQLAWLEGGTDADGVERQGCLDKDRQHGRTTLPHHVGWSVLSVDPSPSEWWGLTWWIMHPESHKYEAVEIHRKRMSSEAFLSADMHTMEFSGIAEEIRMRSVALGHPLQALILEVNAAQKFLLAQPHVQLWSERFGVQLMPHTTTINKADPVYGVTGTADFFRQAAIRLPYGDVDSRLIVDKLIRELTNWPEGDTEDLVMSVWFAIRAVQMTYADPETPAPRFERPGWLHRERGLRGMYQETDDMLPLHIRGVESAHR